MRVKVILVALFALIVARLDAAKLGEHRHAHMNMAFERQLSASSDSVRAITQCHTYGKSYSICETITKRPASTKFTYWHHRGSGSSQSAPQTTPEPIGFNEIALSNLRAMEVSTTAMMEDGAMASQRPASQVASNTGS
ncbi:hypothetical protein L207DRAFT_635296 [Hyaloscypha variabilis F]|uniref:Uncharacterized protein n=1 Tax=Hyaloscypha variabilis (strain UAMH 11265 / GT02V1 / F) TaxID=1149755 RepID=A0A2J6RH27_HYAVF|nr:hypothetical protein L207DRAFT_635296 [Hyaloscypha variabilis F]